MENIKSLKIEFKKNIFKFTILKKLIRGAKDNFLYLRKLYYSHMFLEISDSRQKQILSSMLKENKEYLYRTAFMYIKDEEKTLEAIKETTLRGFNNINGLNRCPSFNIWITRILLDVILEIIKREAGNDKLKEYVEVGALNYGAVIEKDMGLYEIVDFLNYQYKSVIILKYFNDLSIQEIALIMGISEENIKDYLITAERELKEIFMEGDLDE